MNDGPWRHPEPIRSGMRLEMVPEGVLHAFAAEDAASLPARFASPYLMGAECLPIWRVRSAQIRTNPSDAPWVTRFIMMPGAEAPVGMAGFHGPPDHTGMVEVGYQIDPEQRRRGYAGRSLEILLAVAGQPPDVQVVRATISPANSASSALVRRYGFVETGEQWDEEDGLEIIYERDAPRDLERG